MFVRFKTSSAGPDPAKNWSSGEVRDVDDATARQLIADRVADECGAPKGRIFTLPDLCVLHERLEKRVAELEKIAAGGKDPTAWRKKMDTL